MKGLRRLERDYIPTLAGSILPKSLLTVKRNSGGKTREKANQLISIQKQAPPSSSAGAYVPQKGGANH
jgi:hypothetical protein